MSESKAPEDSAAGIADPGSTEPSEQPVALEEAGQPPVRFKPMSMPSAPFWLILIAGVVLLTIIIASWSVVFIFAVGVALFVVLLPFVNWMTRRGLGRALASLTAVASTVVIAVLVAIFALAIFFNQFLPFIHDIPDRLTEIQANSPAWLASAIQNILDGINGAVANVDPGTIVLGFLQGILGLVGTALALTVLPFFIFYLLVDQPRMAQGAKDGIPKPWRPYVETAVRIFINDFANYFKAEFIVGAIQGTMVTIGVFVIGLVVGPPLSGYALLLGAIAAVMELLPQIGPIIALIPALLLALATSPLAVVLVGIFYLFVFIIEANVLVPKIEGHVIEFSPAMVIFLVAVGISLGGIVGGILVMPVAAIVRDLFGFIFRRLEEDSLMEATAETS